MPKHTAFTLALTAKNARSRPPLETERIDPYQLARDRGLRPGRKDWRSPRETSAFAITAPPKPKASDDRRNRGQGSRLDRWGQIVGTHDDSQRRPLMVRSQALRPPVQRDWQGAKDDGASAATGEEMRVRFTAPDAPAVAHGNPMPLHDLGYHGPAY